MTNPLERYKKDLCRHDFVADAAQERGVNELQRLYVELLNRQHHTTSWLDKALTLVGKEQPIESVQGIYFWGGVGRGKTYLMDMFFDGLPQVRKMRVHFHRFMARVHNELNQLKGQANPLDIVATRFAEEAELLCFDEFYVSDITDAMLLGGLLEKLFAQGVVLVATSNVPPDGLYPNGLQRARFLPAIDLINQHCRVLQLDGGVDYRLRTLESAELYYTPLNEHAEKSMGDFFRKMSGESHHETGAIEVLGRQIDIVRLADGVLWVDFPALCDGPRSQNDYIEIARLYHTVMLANVRTMNVQTDDIARRFISLVDEFYERGVKLIISAEVPLSCLYQGGGLSFEFDRCQSRLVEMQSKTYLARPHLP